MRRPEGFDRPPGERSARSGRDRRGSDRSGLPTATIDRPTVEDPQPSAPRPPRAPRAPREPRPARARTAKAELRAAARARRREERAEVRRFTRRSRHRRAARLGFLGVLLVLVLMVAAAVYSPLLALRHIDITGTSRLQPAQLRGAVDGQLGTPLALLDQKRLTVELGAFPLIRSYSTEIVPPDTLVIRIVERTPVAALQNGAGYQLVDAAGVPIADSAARPAGVPLVRLPTRQGVNGVAFAAMARVLSSLPADLLKRVDTVTATSGDDVAFTLTGTGQTVVWGGSEDATGKGRTLAAMPEYRAGQSGRFSVASPGTATFTAG